MHGFSTSCKDMMKYLLYLTEITFQRLITNASCGVYCVGKLEYFLSLYNLVIITRVDVCDK
jgi:hypothetical protein